jgi:hypothetical protein
MTRYISEAELRADVSGVLDTTALEGQVIVTRENGTRLLFQRLPRGEIDLQDGLDGAAMDWARR